MPSRVRALVTTTWSPGMPMVCRMVRARSVRRALASLSALVMATSIGVSRAASS